MELQKDFDTEVENKKLDPLDGITLEINEDSLLELKKMEGSSKKAIAHKEAHKHFSKSTLEELGKSHYIFTDAKENDVFLTNEFMMDLAAEEDQIDFGDYDEFIND